LAPALGAVPGAVVIRSDEVRKRLCGVSRFARLGPEGYAPEISRRVYQAAAQQAGQVLRSGHAAIVDAVFAAPGDRDAIARLAASAGVPFAGVWLDAPPSVLMARAAGRTGDVSDADSAVVSAQAAQDPGPISWRRLDAGCAAESVVQAAVTALAQFLHDGAAPSDEANTDGHGVATPTAC
jgi:hypothetical protein